MSSMAKKDAEIARLREENALLLRTVQDLRAALERMTPEVGWDDPGST